MTKLCKCGHKKINIRTIKILGDIPLGSTGTAKWNDKFSDWEIIWDSIMNNHGKPIEDGFSQDEFNEFLVEVKA